MAYNLTEQKSATDIIAEVLALHRVEKAARADKVEQAWWWQCLHCHWNSEHFTLTTPGHVGDASKRAHLAAEIDKALGGLTREWGARMPQGTAQQHPRTWTALSRFVTGWIPEGES